MDFDKKYLSIIQKPKTPHNTGQYLTHMNSNNENDIGFVENFDLEELCGQPAIKQKDIELDMELELDYDEETDNISSKRKRFMSCELQADLFHHDDLFMRNTDGEENGFDIKKYKSSLFSPEINNKL